MKKRIIISISILVLLCGASCEKYLDAKPDLALATPQTLKDVAAILNNNAMNTLYSIGDDVMSDDYYLEDGTLKTLSDQLYRDSYVWSAATYHDFDWQYLYNLVFRCNVALGVLDQLNDGGQEAETLRGTALFFRAFCFYHLLQEFSLPYDQENANQLLGIPLKLSGDIEENIKRATQAESYAQVIKDLTTATQLLPKVRDFKTQPSQAAAYAQMARVWLVMGDFVKAGAAASQALTQNNTLMDYNTIKTTLSNPFTLFNDEVILQCYNSGRGGVFAISKARVDSTLYQSYHADDLRKVLFFQKNTNGSYAFKGDYSGRNASNLFAGLTTDELYLIEAECEVRNHQLTKGLASLNTLLSKRWRNGSYVPYQSNDEKQVLKKVLLERRKELLFRANMRWADVRRLSKEADFAVSMRRVVEGKVYTLAPGDLRFANLIPQNTVLLSGVVQNER